MHGQQNIKITAQILQLYETKDNNYFCIFNHTYYWITEFKTKDSGPNGSKYSRKLISPLISSRMQFL